MTAFAFDTKQSIRTRHQTRFGYTLAAIHANTIFTIGKAFRNNPDGKLAYAMRTYISTFIGQFLDNFIFSVIVFVFFAPIFWDGFSWTVIQCAMCSLTGAFAELIMEIIFSPMGYKITTNWKKHNVGKEYLEYRQGTEQ